MRAQFHALQCNRTDNYVLYDTDDDEYQLHEIDFFSAD